MAETGLGALTRTARTLGRRRGGGKTPSLWLLTDPDRTPDPVAAVERLPRGSGVIFRTFGASDATIIGRGLRLATRRKALVFLVARDWRLAAEIGADGVHLPEHWMTLAPRLKRLNSRWIITAAAHNPRAVATANRLDIDALLVSPVFASNSPSAGRPLGPVGFERLVRASRTPVIALGGVNAKTAARLRGSSAIGLAAIEGLAG